MTLEGNGTWPFTVEVVGEDLVVHDTFMTCFGGIGGGVIYDPDDSGKTAFGRNTKFEEIAGVALPLDTRNRPVDHQTHVALDGSPIPWMPGGTLVEVNIEGFKYTPPDGLVDVGPGHRVQKVGHPKALDFTVWAARHVDKYLAAAHGRTELSPKQLARGFECRGSYRIIGGAKFVV